MKANCTPRSIFTYYSYAYSNPLLPYRSWAILTGASHYDYSTGPCRNQPYSCIVDLQNTIIGNMADTYGNNSSTQFVIVGFSGGAPMATGVANGAIDKGIPASGLTVVELDSRLNTTNNSLSEVQRLMGSDATFISITSWEYEHRGILGHGDYELVPNNIYSGIPFHTWLAQNVPTFVNYVLPYLP
jgi:hypothetical protein